MNDYAWEKHITEYHAERLSAQILSAAHHGSRTFFRYDEKDDPYLTALKTIDPDYVIVSAPKCEDSPHGHPHKDAMGYYEDQVGADNVLHTGAIRESYICDIFADGTYEVRSDTKLVDEYGTDSDDEDDDDEGGGGGQKSNSGGGGNAARIAFPAVFTKIDNRPMGHSL